MARYLTKSRFKIGMECPTKLFYLDQPKVYGNQSIDDPFLRALAMGGFQVGELAKIEFPGGTEITETDHTKAWTQTQELLKQDDVTIFEASLMFENCFVKVDVLKKSGNSVQLIEVKSKSYDPKEPAEFISKKKRKDGLFDLKADWKPYVADVAFQTFVARNALPGIDFSSYLMLVDKTARTTVDGLNQLFLLKKDQNGRSRVERDPNLKPSDIGASILTRVDVSDVVSEILSDKVVIIDDDKHGVLPFGKSVSLLREIHDKQKLVLSEVGKKCKECEFRIKEELKSQGLKSGFEQCWKTATAKEVSGSDNFVFDIWNFRSEKAIADGSFFFNQIDLNNFEEVEDASDVIQFTPKQRQWLQVKTHNDNVTDAVVLEKPLSDAISSYKYPFHFIDFETTGVAIPFFSGGRPYSQVAFQFSHHIMHADGRVEHAGQFFNDAPGVFPNFKFVRALKDQLSKDNGTIFRYAAHENTVLCEIARQLETSTEADKDDLISWIRTITTRRSENGLPVVGERSMIDMCELVKLYYYSPHMKGSNSIKKVLPAVLHHSAFLQSKYCKPVYGSSKGIKSLNYKDWTWINIQNGKVTDPYKRLPEIFEGMDTSELELLMDSSELADGGAAMTAYARMQFTQMTDIERAKLKEALLKYCELDTLAMVMIFEYWLYDALSSKSDTKRIARSK